MKLKQYTCYVDGRYVSEGTAFELAEVLKVKPNTIYKHFSRTRSGENGKTEIYEVEDEKDLEGEE